VRRTWHLLNECFPKHHVRIQDALEFVQDCPICQKTRLARTAVDTLPAVVRHLKVPHARLTKTAWGT
jgi:hypothetical protein